jgi:hypothetical protein
MKARISIIAACLGLTTIAPCALGQGPSRPDPPRLVLVELFTSQGCDMCPEAERVLGAIAAKSPRVVPIAFHVDYFNDPWNDPFSDKLHSERQAAYNALYTGPKNPEYGLYYTPMVMVDGVQSVNGRDPEAIQAAVRLAQARKPQVSLDAKLDLKDDRHSGDLRINLASRSSRINGRDVLVCAVLIDDQVVTRVGSGENANRTLTSRFPARSTRFEFTRLDAPKALSFSFRLDPSWSTERLAIAAFAQDRKSGEIYRSALVPWAPRGAERDRRQSQPVVER